MITNCYIVLYRLHIPGHGITISNTWGRPIGSTTEEKLVDTIIERHLKILRDKGETLAKPDVISFKINHVGTLYKAVRVQTEDHEVPGGITIPGSHIYHVHNSQQFSQLRGGS